MFFGILLGLMIIGIVSFEALIYLLFRNHPLEWMKAGAPLAFGQTSLPRGVDSWIFARHRIQKQLLFRIPRWAEKDPIAFPILIVHKISFILFLSGIIGFLLFALLLS